MCVVLLEPPDPGESSERTGYLVAVEDTKVSQAEGELLPGTDAVVEDLRIFYISIKLANIAMVSIL